MRHKIIIADDEESIRLLLRRIFSDHIVLAAADGQAALRLIAAESPSVVLLDLNMPLMSGLEVLYALKNTDSAPLVIVLTGNDDLDSARKALELGAISYITKPFEAGFVMKAVLSAFDIRENGKHAADKPWRVKKAGD